jgi:hypothetical protein
MLISLRHRFIFVHIPKNAGTAIRSALDGKIPVDAAQTWAEQFYSVTNNPQALHFLSGVKILPHHMNQADLQPFLDHIGQRVDDFFEFAVVRHPYQRVSSLSRYSSTVNRINNTKPSLTIDQVLDKIEENKESFYASQLHWTTQPASKKIHIYRYENLDNDWQDIRSKLKLDLPDLPKVNVSPGQQALTPDQQARCYSLLEREFTELGYER